ncbi:MAG: amidohydrolase family protein [Syntrophorhabdales bacterium]|jgi:2,3-dihydroxybenzoate decarboxylase
MKKIDLETHFYTKDFQDYMMARKEMPREELYKGFVRLWYEPNVWESHGVGIEDSLLDLSEGRLKAMDEAGIDIQVLSLSTPGCEQFSPEDGTVWSKKTNDQLARAVGKHPDRFIGLAALAPQSPQEAAAELERAVKELGLRGAKLNSHIGPTYLDDKRYWVILKKAQELDVPIYLHPTTPHPSMLKPYTDYGYALTGPSLGFGAETAVHAMRMIYSGIFDEYPDLKVILGHLGEGLLFWMYRIDFGFVKPWVDEELQPKIRKRPSEYIRNNFFITTSGMFAAPAFMCVFLEMGADRMMFASDFPYESCSEAAQFMDKVAAISDIDKKKICHVTAEKLFKLS